MTWLVNPPVGSEETTDSSEVTRHCEERPACPHFMCRRKFKPVEPCEPIVRDEAICRCFSNRTRSLPATIRRESIVVSLVHRDGPLLPIGGGFYAILAQAAFADQMGSERLGGSGFSCDPRITIAARQRQRRYRLLQE